LREGGFFISRYFFPRKRSRESFTAKVLNPKARIITRTGQARYAQALRNSGADEVVIPAYEGGFTTGRMIAKFYPVLTNLE
jgi:hypothetical protein